jgi:ammonium transporter Rh
MMFVGFGFLMTFLKKYGYSAIGFNFILAAFVLEWAMLVEGWIEMIIHGTSYFEINVHSLLVSDFSSAAVLISFGAVIGKVSLSQLLVMALIEVVFQRFNEYVGLHHIYVIIKN